MEQDDFYEEKLNACTACRIQLVTYCQANLTKVPSRKDFGRF